MIIILKKYEQAKKIEKSLYISILRILEIRRSYKVYFTRGYEINLERRYDKKKIFNKKQFKKLFGEVYFENKEKVK